MCAVELVLVCFLLTAPRDSEVPKLTGERVAIAKQIVQLRDLKLQVGVFYLSPKNWRQDIKRDVIYLQSPQPGTKVSEGTTVAAWMFEAAQPTQTPTEVPDVRGKPIQEALSVLKQAGFIAMNATESGDSARVVDQFPRAGNFAYAGTSVYLTTGNGGPVTASPPSTPVIEKRKE
jgi:beta-lactam-binding protein with PASTA domain